MFGLLSKKEEPPKETARERVKRENLLLDGYESPKTSAEASAMMIAVTDECRELEHAIYEGTEKGIDTSRKYYRLLIGRNTNRHLHSEASRLKAEEKEARKVSEQAKKDAAIAAKSARQAKHIEFLEKSKAAKTERLERHKTKIAVEKDAKAARMDRAVESIIISQNARSAKLREIGFALAMERLSDDVQSEVMAEARAILDAYTKQA